MNDKQQSRKDKQETRNSRFRKKSLGTVTVRSGRLIWVPSDYSRDVLNIGSETDCGPSTDPSSETAVDDCFQCAYQARKQFRAERKLEKATLTDAEYRARRNDEVARRLVAMARRREAEAA
jgi:hypothetical protein